MGSSWYRQEYGCSFEALEGLVYADFKNCVVSGLEPPAGKKVGGIDFGLRNPLAAVWGVLDRDDVLWITGEHYVREKPLSYHARFLPRDVTWYADPEGAREICELRCAGFTILRGDNAKKPGISAVQARLEDGSLKVVKGRCPNLIAESELYHYDPEDKRKSEDPVKEYDHALDALRYLVSKVDARRLGKRKFWLGNGRGAIREVRKEKNKKPWLRLGNKALWTALN
jgi:phage terminase large subunit